MKKRIQVVCGVFFRDTARGFEVALFERAKDPRVFEFPGGKIEPNETKEQALVRELEEELNLHVQVGRGLGSVVHAYAQLEVELYPYWVSLQNHPDLGRWPTAMKLADHARVQWVAGLGDLPAGAIAGADVPFLKKIFEAGLRPG